ncbi:hypothetical protein RF11_15976 [Thelohanellus kitauei]|uniref:Uncharacterized protein n=1 Tax=Thelohanellus kitauei TaxID=669202 RepID=A0A0C2MY10_THEKT|nr:hypothetical protein RF11_15976 [Thelohanellus kitauei]
MSQYIPKNMLGIEAHLQICNPDLSNLITKYLNLLTKLQSFRFSTCIENKNDCSIRIGVNYLKINEITIQSSSPLPLVSDIENKLSGFNILSRVDLCYATGRSLLMNLIHKNRIRGRVRIWII